jgi:predicted secreted protein
MATRTVLGKDLLLLVDGKAIGCATDVSFSSSVEMVEAACRESGNFYDAEPGKFTATLSTSGFVKIDTPEDTAQTRYWNLADLHLNKTKIAWVFGTNIDGEKELHGNAYITSYSQEGPQDGNATYSIELQVVGTYAQRANPVGA